METVRKIILTMTMIVVVESGEELSTNETLQVMYVSLGDPAIFKCELKAAPGQNIAWVKDEQNAEALSNRHSINKEWATIFRIFHTQLSDDGNYSCFIEEEPARGRNTFSLQVAIPPLAKITSSKTASYHEMSNVSVVCRSRGKPPPTFLWIIDQHQIYAALNDTSLQIQRMTAHVRRVASHTYESTLQINAVEYKDFGLVSCTAFNKLTTSRDVLLLNITYPPKTASVHNTSSPVYWWPGHRVNLTCGADGNSPPVITWFTHSRDQGGGHVTVNCSTIEVDQRENEITSTCWIDVHSDHIKNKTYDNETNFSCHAQNQFGKIIVHEFLVRRAYVPPPVQFHLTNLHNNIAELSAQISSDKFTLPAVDILVTVKWMATGREYERLADVVVNGQTTIKLPGIVENSTYIVSMSARNKAGYGPLTTLIIFTDQQVTTTTIQPSNLVLVTSHNNHTSAMNRTDDRNTASANTRILYKLQDNGGFIDLISNVSSLSSTNNTANSNKIISRVYFACLLYIFYHQLILNVKSL